MLLILTKPINAAGLRLYDTCVLHRGPVAIAIQILLSLCLKVCQGFLHPSRMTDQ